MNVQHHQPRNEVLQKYIEYYYFVKTVDSGFETKYYSFPHILTPISIHQNVFADINYYSTSVFESKTKNNAALIQGMRRQPLFVRLKGKLDKFTIAFKPAGLNNFVTKSFLEICPNDSQFFLEWDENPFYKECLRNIYETENEIKRVGLLEDFLLSIYRPIENSDILEKAVSILMNFDADLSIENTAHELGLNIRTFNRFFKEHFGISPIGFKQIARFRHSMNNKLFNEQFRCLTEIAYNSNYYDQSYFIRIYKQMAGSNPKIFFDAVEKVGAGNLFFQFLNI